MKIPKKFDNFPSKEESNKQSRKRWEDKLYTLSECCLDMPEVEREILESSIRGYITNTMLQCPEYNTDPEKSP